MKGIRGLNRHIKSSLMLFRQGTELMESLSRKKSLRVADSHAVAGRNRWAVILAGGDGTRLQSLTRTIAGDERPKQFCALFGGRTLLDETRNRVATTVAENQTFLLVTKTHERFYKESLASSSDRLLVQPENKGTAPAIIYALTRIAWKAPDAIVAFFPSDHYFGNDEAFMWHVETAFSAAQARRETVILLGISPESPEVEYGWIDEPQSMILGSVSGAISRVRRFWEKPSASLAKELMNRGCLWNSFVMVGRVGAFLKMARRALPELCDYFAAIVPSFETAAEPGQLRELYSWIPPSNFSHDVLALRPADLAVIRVDEVGWSDLGEPSRVLTTLARFGFSKPMGRVIGPICPISLIVL